MNRRNFLATMVMVGISPQLIEKLAVKKDAIWRLNGPEGMRLIDERPFASRKGIYTENPVQVYLYQTRAGFEYWAIHPPSNRDTAIFTGITTVVSSNCAHLLNSKQRLDWGYDIS